MAERRDADSGSVDADLTAAGPSRVSSTETIGPYRLLERLGEGGMGEVWLAEQTRPVRRQVALKVIKAGMDTAQVVARFEAERQALALMDHPAIARVFDAGATPQGRPYFAMEYVRGETITAFATRNQLTIPDRIDLFFAVCEGVQHAHQKGIIHRDLKPSNVLVTTRDDHAVPKIIDFGVAKAITQTLTDRTLHTELGALIGTPEYMSPEQADMTGLDVDTRTDVYALGTILYELLTGVLPFETVALREKGLDEIRRTIREVDPPRPSTRVTMIAGAGTTRRRQHTVIAREILDTGARAIEQDLRSQPEVQARLQTTIGAVYTNLGRYSAAEPLLRRASDTMNRTAGADDPASLNTASALAELYWNQGRFRDAQSLYEQVVAGRTRRLGAGHRDTLKARFDLASTYGAQNQTAEAERLTLAVLEDQRRLLGEEDSDTVQSIGNLSSLYWRSGRYAEALPLAMSAVEIQRKVLGPDHPDTLADMHNVATTYDRLDRNADAESMYVATIDAKRRVEGEAHPSTLLTELRFAQMLQKLGRFADAETQLLRAQAALAAARSGADPQRAQQIREQLVALHAAWGRR